MKKSLVIDKLLPFELSALADDKPSLDIDLSPGMTTAENFEIGPCQNLTPEFLSECFELLCDEYIWSTRYNYVPIQYVSVHQYEWIMKTPEEWEELLRHTPKRESSMEIGPLDENDYDI